MINKYSEEGIPVDVYKRGINVYVDFENIDLSKINGYEEVIKGIKKK